MIAAVLVLLGTLPAAARAADPGRWVQTSLSEIPIEYYQGIAPDTAAGRLLFDGVYVGGYRTDLELREQARNANLLPLAVTASEGFNHLGDPTFTGGRLILPLECYTPGAPNAGNTCGRGAFGVADANLTWLGRTLLDPADVPKAMWVEASPDGQLLWTSAGQDLLAYRTSDVQPAAGDVPIRPVRRLPGAVPPSGITGAAFFGGRLLLAGQGTGPFQVWSVDPATGARRLEIERTWAGESEGLGVVDALGGWLHWMIQPLDPQGRTPTFGTGHGELVSFVPRAAARLRLQVRTGARGRLIVTASLRFAGSAHPVAGARVRAGGASARTDARGRAVLRVGARRSSPLRVTATKPPLRRGRLVMRAGRG
ncbi:hypothetical protein DSM104329_01183 [Capillimicrobium parvum]|uniref:Uncharacterized protein n=2 Tax=Capillimicrobium parvum TaxID=2884022 RepID=A0A9E7BYZ6_9ACTN|nr:hypothetical protein DSM104329_01183 [Capillimicrobium parvum]